MDTLKYTQNKINNKNAPISKIQINNSRVPRKAPPPKKKLISIGSLGKGEGKQCTQHEKEQNVNEKKQDILQRE